MTSTQVVTLVDAAAIGGFRTAVDRSAEPIGGQVILTGSGWQRTVFWYDSTYLGTPAFWIEQTRRRPRPQTYQVGSSLLEEVAFSVLGGYGITEQMAYAAFARCRDRDLLIGNLVSEDDLRAALSEPFVLHGRSRPVRYRFPMLKAQRLAASIALLNSCVPPASDDPRELRDWLTSLPGVGPKTASWVVRNLTGSDAIAVVDVHIRRAGLAAGIFDPAWRLPRDYLLFEEAFVAWAYLGAVHTADLDACIWSGLASLGRGARTLFGVKHLSELD